MTQARSPTICGPWPKWIRNWRRHIGRTRCVPRSGHTHPTRSSPCWRRRGRRDRSQAAQIRRRRAQRLRLAPRAVRCDARASPDRATRHAGADHGRPARRAPDARAGRQASAGLGRGGVDIRQPASVRRERRSRQVSEDARRRPGAAARRRGGDRVHPDGGADVPRRADAPRCSPVRWVRSWKVPRGQHISRAC